MRLRTAHISLQFSDTNHQHTADIEKLFRRANKRNYAWITGTEGGPGSGNTSSELLRVSRDAGYRPWIPSEQSSGDSRSTACWLVVRKDLIKGDWKPTFTPAIPGSRALYDAAGVDATFPKWGPRGLVAVSFQSLPELGEIGVAAAHHLPSGRDPKNSTIHGVNHYKQNEKLDDVIAEWMRKTAKGSAIAFCNMDRNFRDTKRDAQSESIGNTTTLADELKKWQNTGHGAIDWMLSYNRDRRVVGRNFHVLNDREFFLHTDHFLLEGVFGVEPLAA